MADQKPGIPYCLAPIFHFIPMKNPKTTDTA